MDIELYTTGCPKCNVLEKKLDMNGIEYIKNENFDVNELLEQGLDAAPVLKVDGMYMPFTEAVKWINKGGVACR